MNAEPLTIIAHCRSCGSDRLTAVFDLGSLPLSDGFSKSATAPDPSYPLTVVFCEDCALAQLRHTVDPALLFADDYPYYSSYTNTVVDNAAANVAEALARRPLGTSSLVVELASNDGYLLQHVQARGIPVLGIDPALGPVEAARARGIETVHAFFSRAVAERLVAVERRADLVFANNVLAHVAELGSFVDGIARLLKPEGTAIIEVPYLQTLLDKTAFDTIYHEHLCYFSVTALDRLFRPRGLFLNDVRRLEIHGGSLRLFVEKREVHSPALLELLDAERAAGVDRPAAFADFAEAVAGLGRRVRALLGAEKGRGGRLAAYGAAAKGTILLNAFGIGTEILDFVVDRNPHKHGLFVPGVKLPILPLDALDAARPDMLLLLPWNHRDEIIGQLRGFAERGGRFLVPIPEPVVIP